MEQISYKVLKELFDKPEMDAMDKIKVLDYFNSESDSKTSLEKEFNNLKEEYNKLLHTNNLLYQRITNTNSTDQDASNHLNNEETITENDILEGWDTNGKD